jgi:hypothetical protein
MESECRHSKYRKKRFGVFIKNYKNEAIAKSVK